MKTALVCGFLLAISCAVPIRADVLTTYNVTFTGTGIPTAGSFTYDSTVPQFSNFLVNWDGYSFNLTSSANNPMVYDGSPACVGSNTGAAAGFAVLTTCNTAGDSEWEAAASGSSAQFNFLSNISGCSAFGPCENIFEGIAIPPVVGAYGGGGNFSIAAVRPAGAAPEPGTLTLAWTAAVAGSLLWMRRRRLGLQL